jgi:hypothetical protein
MVQHPEEAEAHHYYELLWCDDLWTIIGGWNKQVRRTRAQKEPPSTEGSKMDTRRCTGFFFFYNFWSINARNFKSGSKYWQLNCAHFNHTLLGSFHSTLWRKNSLNTQISFFCLHLILMQYCKHTVNDNKIYMNV